MKWEEERLTTRLSTKSARMLLSLLLVRRAGRIFGQAEFAEHHGLPQTAWSVPGSIFVELEEHGLIQSIQRVSERAQAMSVAMPERYYDEVKGTKVTVTEVGPDHIGSPAQPLLLGRGTVDDSGQLAGTSGIRRDAPGDTPESPTDPIELCRRADENGSPAVKREALRAVWDIAFPPDKYPSQRLTDGGVQRLLFGGRRAEDVGRAILKAPDTAKGKINYPLAYVTTALSSMEREQQGQGAEEEEAVITDDLRKLTELGRKRYGNTTTPETA